MSVQGVGLGLGLGLGSWRAICSSSWMRAVILERVTPMTSQNLLTTVALKPRRRSPSRVTRRGSSQPSTCPCSTRCLSLRLDMTQCVMLRREYSHVVGLYL